MNTLQDKWRQKTDDEVEAAAESLAEYTEEGRNIILAEVERRRASADAEELTQKGREGNLDRLSGQPYAAPIVLRDDQQARVSSGEPLLDLPQMKLREWPEEDVELETEPQTYPGEGTAPEFFRESEDPKTAALVPPSNPVLVCALGLLAAFFLPWVQIFGVGLSGYNFGQVGSYGNYAWVVPILAAATILRSFTGGNNRGIGAIAGIVPLGAILYGLISLGGEGGPDAAKGIVNIAEQVLSIGGWLTIIFAFGIIIAAFAPTPTATNQSRNPREDGLRNTFAFHEEYPLGIQPEQHTGNISDEIARLADLHAKGILDAAEFKAAKAKLLA